MRFTLTHSYTQYTNNYTPQDTYAYIGIELKLRRCAKWMKKNVIHLRQHLLAWGQKKMMKKKNLYYIHIQTYIYIHLQLEIALVIFVSANIYNSMFRARLLSWFARVIWVSWLACRRRATSARLNWRASERWPQANRGSQRETIISYPVSSWLSTDGSRDINGKRGEGEREREEAMNNY